MLKLLSFLVLFLSCNLHAQSSVWKISKGDHVLYVGGTCHLLRPSDYPLPAEFELAYAAAKTLVFEMNPATANTPDFALKLLNKTKYTDSRNLKSVLSEQAYSALAKKCAKNGLSIEVLGKTKPFMVVMTLLVQELTACGVSEEGVDMHFYRRALDDNKQTQSLETPDFQIDLIASIDEGIENEVVFYGLEDMNKIQNRFDKLIGAWRNGETESLEKNFIAQMSNHPTLYSRILVNRNLKWAEIIEEYLDDSEVEFILVGVAHLAGEKSLLSILKKAGYGIEQIVASD